MKLRAIILGCGSSGGVPRIGGPGGVGDWGDCDPSEPKNRRRRCSILVQRADDQLGWEAEALTTILVDTSPDMRLQLLDARVGRLDAVVMTHEHADQCHGIDDLRALAMATRARVPVWFAEETCPALTRRFSYCFTSNPKTGYPAILDARTLSIGEGMDVDGPTGPIPVLPILLHHGPIDALGFRFGGTEEGQGLCYSPDTNGVPEASWPLLKGADVWITDALRYTPHASHAHVAMALEWLERARARRGVLTNLHIDIDYGRLAEELPGGIVPAHDGMIIEAAS